MLQKIMKLSLMKARNYKIQPKWSKLLFNIIYYSLTFAKFLSQIFASILITTIKRVRIQDACHKQIKTLCGI
jgi:hypothetical protein